MSQDQPLNILFIADIVGKAGLDITQSVLPRLVNEYKIDCVIANGENAASGKGLTPALARTLKETGIHIITSGNHIWDKDKIYDYFAQDPYLIRPLNYPAGAYGNGSCIYKTHSNDYIGVINIQGRSFMYPIDCPFRKVDTEIDRLKRSGVSAIIVDFHAESTAEKIALSWYLDGRISALIGTHTHVQTADEHIMPKGSAYITDVGMTGPYNSVIGMQKESAIQRFLTQMPVRYRIATEMPRLNGVVIQINKSTMKAINIKRIQLSQ